MVSSFDFQYPNSQLSQTEAATLQYVAPEATEKGTYLSQSSGSTRKLRADHPDRGPLMAPTPVTGQEHIGSHILSLSHLLPPLKSHQPVYVFHDTEPP